MALLFLLLTCGGVSAAPMSIPKTANLHPLLLGDPMSIQSPLHGALNSQAAALTVLAGTNLAPAPVLAGTLWNAATNGTPLVKAAALVSARLIADPPAAEAFFAARPKLETGPLGRLPGMARTGDPYRGADADSALLQISEFAARDESVSWLFDGGQPPTELTRLARSGKRMWAADGRAFKLSGHDELTAPHPFVPGAEVIGLRRLQDQTWLAVKRQKISALAGISAGPRWLGDATVSERGRIDLHGTYPMGVVESVYGRPVIELADKARFGPEEHALVEQLLDKLARARLYVNGLGMANIMIGRTLADPELRAFVTSPGNVLPIPPEVHDEDARRFIEKQTSFVRMVTHSHHGGEVITWSAVWKPLGEALRDSITQPRIPFLARLRRLFGREGPKQLAAGRTEP